MCVILTTRRPSRFQLISVYIQTETDPRVNVLDARCSSLKLCLAEVRNFDCRATTHFRGNLFDFQFEMKCDHRGCSDNSGTPTHVMESLLRSK